MSSRWPYFLEDFAFALPFAAGFLVVVVPVKV
jgi:hypothetical protein